MPIPEQFKKKLDSQGDLKIEKAADDAESVAKIPITEAEITEKEKIEKIEEEFEEVEEVSGETRATVRQVRKCPYCGGNLGKMKQPNIFQVDFVCYNCDIGYRDD